MNKWVMKVGFKKLNQDAVIPKKAHHGDAGMDICSSEDVVLSPLRPVIVKTGLAANIPGGYEIQVRPRSGLSAKGVTVANAPGTIDSGYKGEIGVILVFLAADPLARFTISKGDRIAQLVVEPVCPCETEEVDDVGTSDRGSGGFGSTGK